MWRLHVGPLLGVNRRRVLRMGSWNVLSLSDNQRLPHLSDELSRLRVDMVGLSETRRPGSARPVVRILLTTGPARAMVTMSRG